MLTFLRKIRKSLIDSVSSRKYLLYAIGEIALVVIGILIALQINNWNEWRKDRVKEKSILMELKETVDQNIELMEHALEVKKEYNRSSRIILSFLKNESGFKDSINIHFYLASLKGIGNLLRLSSTGYEALKNAGYDLVISEYLRGDIIYLFDNQIPYLQARIQQGGLHHNSLYEDYLTKNFIRESNEYVPLNITQLLQDHYCYSMFKDIESTRVSLFKWVSETLLESKRVLQLIKTEIGETE